MNNMSESATVTIFEIVSWKFNLAVTYTLKYREISSVRKGPRVQRPEISTVAFVLLKHLEREKKISSEVTKEL